MATIINTPGGNNNGESTGAGMVIGAILVILIVVLVLLYAVPYFRNQMRDNNSNPTINVEVPLPSGL